MKDLSFWSRRKETDIIKNMASVEMCAERRRECFILHHQIQGMDLVPSPLLWDQILWKDVRNIFFQVDTQMRNVVFFLSENKYKTTRLFIIPSPFFLHHHYDVIKYLFLSSSSSSYTRQVIENEEDELELKEGWGSLSWISMTWYYFSDGCWEKKKKKI